MEITSIILKVLSKEYEVLSYNIRFTQQHNSTTGNPSSKPIADVLYVEVISDGENDLMDWMIDAIRKEDGELSFKAGNQLQKTTSFKGGCLVGYSQNLGTVNDPIGGTSKVVTEDLVISFQEITSGDVTYKRGAES